MAVLGLIVLALARILGLLVDLYQILLLGRMILSWVNPDPSNPIVRFLYQVTEPVLSRVRRLMPHAFFKSGFDLSPFIVLILLMILDIVVVGSLYDLAAFLRHR